MGGRGARFAHFQGVERHQGCPAKSEDTASTGEDQAKAGEGERGASFRSGLSLVVPTRLSKDSHLDFRTFRGYSLQMGRVFDAGGRALDNATIFCAKCGAVYWERADALCRQCSEFPGGRASQLRKLRSGLFPNQRHPGWTVEHVRRPTLDEATTLVAQLESCEAGLGRMVMGPTTPKKQRVAPQAAVLALGKRRRGYRQREPGAAAFRPWAFEFIGGVWAQRSVGVKAHPQGWWGSQDRLMATQVVFHGLFSTAQARLRRYVCRGLRWFFQLRKRGRALQHLDCVAGGTVAFPHRRGDAAAAYVGRSGLGGNVVPLCMRRVMRGALRLGSSRVRLTSEKRVETAVAADPQRRAVRRLAGKWENGAQVLGAQRAPTLSRLVSLW